MILRAMFFSFFLFVSSVSQAASCYSPVEAEAEQGIRIHSELMVIGLNCQAMRFSDGTNLYNEYSKFTEQHADIFATYEKKLMDYFQARGDADPEASLNTLRTNFANKISLDSVNMKPHNFCNRYANRVMKVRGMSGDTLRKWASTPFPSHPVSQPLCR